MIDLHNMDCMDYLRECPDKAFDLAIVDPPYGINVANMNMGVGTGDRCPKAENRLWVKKDWDHSPPKEDYFRELARVSRRQIIWGGNYFRLPPSQYFAVWDKGGGLRGRSFAEGEYAWVSDGGTRIVQINPVDKARFHPTQKPIKLYQWLLENYAKPGQRILDTHLGSGSSAIAAHYFGVDFVGIELDADYFAAAKARIDDETKQIDLLSA